MILEETKQLLRTHRLTPNKLLGQNFMIEDAFYPKMCTYSALNSSDVVLDAGAGFGFLSKFLSSRCKSVVAVEKDCQVAGVLCEQVQGLVNVQVIVADVLTAELPPFNKAVAIPPYYLSSKLVLWLLERKVDCAVMIVQTEFANRLVAPVGSEDYGWLTVATYQAADAEILDTVSKEMFYPQPEVDSVIVRLKPWSKPPFNVENEALFRQLAKWLFTQRNKKLTNALVPFLKNTFKLCKEDAEKKAANLPYADKRARELSPENFGELADALSN
ncbi:MAG: 16S rRNA (adenine(1518)-N(6)/adenine(1519)-N(6))-dimethyltransferase RsmA [Candidatus Bathyarchaeota archaeon]|nr:16S rRNA (adenine(1518)-N(6)/adenine(1519)-N(6))-dimethyltransferase RsmA [Candidatus Bathyarchaeota archaeon]